MNKVLILLRGLPGAGKTTVAELLGCECFAADDYPGLYDGGFHTELLGRAHHYCMGGVIEAMQKETPRIAVHNTLTTPKELGAYYQLATEFGYKVVSLIVENRHGNKSVHDVSEEVMDKMEKRFDVKLR